MNTFTPGPWKVLAGTIIETDDHDEKWIATVPEIPFYETRANARLIAAAPELLESCEKLLGAIECWIANPEDVVANARAAIAKAKGEEPK